MKPVPRLLPLTAVAIGGVLAVKALAGVQALPALMAGAKAMAEEAPAAGPPAKQVAMAKPAPLPPTSAAAPRPFAPACALSPADLAKEAGLSPGELQTLQNLSTRRGQIDDRAKALDTQIQLLAAAEVKVDGKMKALNALKAELQGLLGQQSQQQEAEIDRLVVVYSKMKPRDAAAIMATLDDRVRIPVAAKMKERNLADILAQMPTVEAKKITEELSGKMHPQSVTQADSAQPANPAPANGPVQTAKAAAPAPSDESAEKTAQASPKPVPAKPVHLAARKPEPRKPESRKLEPRKQAVARARTDTPTMKAAKAVAVKAPAPQPVRPPVQSAAAAPRPVLVAPKPALVAPKPASAPAPASAKPALPPPTAAASVG